MSKVDLYRAHFRALPVSNWEPYLLAESRLPGPRGNLELVQAVSLEGDESLFRRFMQHGPAEAPFGSALEFLPVCGVVGLGRLLTAGRNDILDDLRAYASDPRWRMREGVAMALQHWGAQDMDGLLQAMEAWAGGNWLERRAAAAAVCEPALLHQPAHVDRVLALLDALTASMAGSPARRTEEFRVLRKALGYCWSVAVAASPAAGKQAMGHWFESADPDVQWIMRENLKKDRLKRLDAAWTSGWEMALASAGETTGE